MLEDTNSLDVAHLITGKTFIVQVTKSIKRSSFVEDDAAHIGHSDRSGDESVSSQYFRLWSNKDYFMFISLLKSRSGVHTWKDTDILKYTKPFCTEL